MLTGRSSRLDFLRASGALTIGAGITLSLEGCRDAAGTAADAMRNGDGPRVLEDPDRGTLEAFADRILPPDGESAGATAMGAVVFMDHYAATRPEVLAFVRRHVAELNARARALLPGSDGFASLDQAAAEGLFATMAEESRDDFQTLQSLVVFGVFAAPARGGNLDEAGWALLAYENQHAWQPPFGYYDAEAARTGGTP